MNTLVRRYVTIAIVGTLCLGGWFAYSRSTSKAPAATAGSGAAEAGAAGKNATPEPPHGIPVTATHVHRRDVPIYLDGLGTVQAFHTVTVRSQIEAQIDKIHFSEGQNVHAGDLLVEMDARSYQAQLDQTLAKKKQDQAKVVQDRAKVLQDEARRAQDQALEAQSRAKKHQDELNLANARINLKRNQESFAGGAITEQAVEDQRSVMQQQEAAVQAGEAAIQAALASIQGDAAAIVADQANVASDQAAVELDEAAIKYAQTILSYAKITAPIDGRTGIRQVDAGNLVRLNDTGGIVVLTQLQPISVVFSLPQQYLFPVNERRAQAELKVIAMDPDAKIELDQGTLLLVDNQIEQTTGALRLKATFPNLKGKLWPGGFVNIRLLLETRQNATVVSAPAVQTGPNGTFVFLIKPDLTVEMKSVKVALIQDGKAIIEDGVADGDQLVLSGHDRLKPGATVAIGKKNPDDAAPKPPDVLKADAPAAPTASGESK